MNDKTCHTWNRFYSVRKYLKALLETVIDKKDNFVIIILAERRPVVDIG